MFKSFLRVRAMLVLLTLLFLWYLLFSLEAIRVKKNKLERIMKMAIETKERLLNVHRTSQNLAVKIARLDKLS